ncbi:MAG: hypothetical protein OEV41_07390, partial [Gammaproteobacteria bacterium]|nr:hypothetical protein [Gammaproteobacteria bacterium]
MFRLPPIVSAVIKAALVLALVATVPDRATGHEVPTSVVVQTIVRPHSEQIDLLVRVPLEAMRDVNFPETGPGYLVISEADDYLRDAATVWIAQEVTLYEDGSPLADWTIGAVRLALPSDRSFERYETAMASLASP